MRYQQVLALALLVVGCAKTAGSSDDPDAEVPPELKPINQIKEKKDLISAVAYARRFMVDAPNKDSTGTALLVAWALRSMTWKSVAVVADETSYAKVRKDISAEIGKRVCVSGTVVQIKRDSGPDGASFLGLLEGASLWRFAAVKSSGDLVGGSQARLCGVVTGTYDYSNSAGGIGHAVTLVGIFDLPENRTGK